MFNMNHAFRASIRMEKRGQMVLSRLQPTLAY